MRTRTLTNLILDVRQRCNLENSTFVTDTEITEYLNQGIARLWTRLAQGSGHPHFRSQQGYTVTTATSIQALPTDFYQLQEMVATFGGVSGSLRPFMASQRGSLLNSGYAALSTVTKYRIQANNVEFLPVTQSFAATMYYVPTQTRLVNGSDVLDGYAGYEVIPIYMACAVVKEKEETSSKFYTDMVQDAFRDIDALIAQRDASAPETVQDVVGTSADVLGWWFR